MTGGKLDVSYDLCNNFPCLLNNLTYFKAVSIFLQQNSRCQSINVNCKIVSSGHMIHNEVKIMKYNIK